MEAVASRERIHFNSSNAKKELKTDPVLNEYVISLGGRGGTVRCEKM